MNIDINRIQDAINAACVHAGRNPQEVKLVAVTKTRPVEIIQKVIDAGITIIGENRLQEADEKFPGLRGNVKFHMIGHLQSNKVKKAVSLFNCIQSVDSIKVARKIQQECEKQNRSMEVLIQINTSGEESKFGFSPVVFKKSIEQIFAMPRLRCKGLMTIGAHTDDETAIRKSFSSLRTLFEDAKAISPSPDNFNTLSMGMTEDFQIAIEEGSTMIRIGRALFGERN